MALLVNACVILGSTIYISKKNIKIRCVYLVYFSALTTDYKYKALYETNRLEKISEIPKQSKAARLSAFDLRTGCGV